MNQPTQALLAEMNMNSLEEAFAYCKEFGIDTREQVMETQPIAFESAVEATQSARLTRYLLTAKALSRQLKLSVAVYKQRVNQAVLQTSAK